MYIYIFLSISLLLCTYIHSNLYLTNNDEEWRPTRRNSSSSDIDVAMMNNSNSDCSLPPPQGESGVIGPENRVFMDPPTEERAGYATDCDNGK